MTPCPLSQHLLFALPPGLLPAPTNLSILNPKWIDSKIHMFHLLQVSCRPAATICYCASIQTNKKTRERVFCFVFCHYLRKMFRLVSAVFFRIAASLLWLVLLSAVFLPVANLTDPLGRQPPQLPDSLWRRESQMCSLSPSSGCFSALVLFSFLSFFFFFCSDGFSLVPIHDRVIYFF